MLTCVAEQVAANCGCHEPLDAFSLDPFEPCGIDKRSFRSALIPGLESRIGGSCVEAFFAGHPNAPGNCGHCRQSCQAAVFRTAESAAVAPDPHPPFASAGPSPLAPGWR